MKCLGRHPNNRIFEDTWVSNRHYIDSSQFKGPFGIFYMFNSEHSPLHLIYIQQSLPAPGGDRAALTQSNLKVNHHVLRK